MFRMVYVSSAVSQMSEPDLIHLLKQSRKNNKKWGISGILLYSDGNFIQMLEGKEKDLNALYQRILKDDRNCGNILINKEPITERAFPEWNMGFKVISSETKDGLDGYSNFLSENMSVDEIANNPSATIKMLYHFKDSCI